MANTDKFIKGARRFSTTIGAGGIADAVATTSPLTTVPSVFQDGDAIEFIVDRVSLTGAKTPSLEETIVGTVSGTNVVDCDRGVEGTAQEHAAGAVVEIKLTADMWNRMLEGLLEEHGLDGAHTDITADSATIEGILLNASMLNSGWIPILETLTYKDADEIYFSGDVTAKYQKSDKLKIVQPTDGAKFFYIISVGSYDSGNDRTPVQVTAGSNFDLDNEAISSGYFSRAESPLEFPDVFNWSPSYQNISVGAGTVTATFRISGKFVFVHYALVFAADTTIAANPYINQPVTNASGKRRFSGTAIYQDGGANRYFGHCWIETENRINPTYDGSGGARASYSVISNTVPFVWTTGDILTLNIAYEY